MKSVSRWVIPELSKSITESLGRPLFTSASLTSWISSSFSWGGLTGQLQRVYIGSFYLSQEVNVGQPLVEVHPDVRLGHSPPEDGRVRGGDPPPVNHLGLSEPLVGLTEGQLGPRASPVSVETEGPELFLERPGLSVVQRSVVFAQVSLAASARVMPGAPGPEVRGRVGRTSLEVVTPGGARGQAHLDPAGLRELDSGFVQR